MGNRRVWLSGGVLVLLLALAIVGMRAWRTHANADGAYEPSAHGTAPPQGSSWWTRTERSPAEPPAGSGEPAAAKPPPWKQDGRSDEEVLANYTQEELEKSGLTPQSMFYRQQAMALVDVLPLASRVGGKDLVQHLRLVGQGLSFAAMPGIKSDPAKVLQAQRDTFARLRKELSAQLGEKLYEEGPTLADWLKKREGDLANAAAGAPNGTTASMGTRNMQRTTTSLTSNPASARPSRTKTMMMATCTPPFLQPSSAPCTNRRPRRRSDRWLLAPVLSCLIAGCSREDPIAREDFCAEWARAVCNNSEHCCESTGPLVHTNPVVCWVAAGALCDAQMPYGTAVEDGRLRYDADEAGRIVAAIVKAGTKCRPPPGFELPYYGTVEVGGDCTPGLADMSPTLACGDGTVCDVQGGLTSARGMCTKSAGVGEPCEDGACNSSSYCDQGTCRARKTDGALCGSEQECQSGMCVLATCAPILSNDYCLL
jgi:hypothetical protein